MLIADPSELDVRDGSAARSGASATPPTDAAAGVRSCAMNVCQAPAVLEPLYSPATQMAFPALGSSAAPE